MRSRWLLAVVFCVPLAAACAAADDPAAKETAPAKSTTLTTDEDKILYAMGVALSQNLSGYDFTTEEIGKIKRGLEDGALHREPQVSMQEFGPQIQGLLQSRMQTVSTREKEAGEAFLTQAAAQPGAEKLDSGLVYREVEPGTGKSPGPTDQVRIHYRGTLRDGTVFDTSHEGDAGEPVTFSLKGVFPCLSEGVQKMKVGGKSVLTCPSDLAFGDRGSPPKVLPGAALQFEVELLDVVEAPVSTTPAPKTDQNAVP